MNHYLAIYQVMIALTAQPEVIPPLGWKEYKTSGGNKKRNKIRRGKWQLIRRGK